MISTAPVVTVSPRDYDAVLFDLDGVLTKTASAHAATWKKLFDGFLDPAAHRDGAFGKTVALRIEQGDYMRDRQRAGRAYTRASRTARPWPIIPPVRGERAGRGPCRAGEPPCGPLTARR